MITFYEDIDSYDYATIIEAEDISRSSPDLSTKTGAVISIDHRAFAAGYNRLAYGAVPLEERFQRPEKYLWTVHSEIVALGTCARDGLATDGATLYSNWWPCADCTRAIIEAGIVRVVGVKPDTTHPKYGHEFEVSLQMLKEAGVECCFIGKRVQAQK